MNQRRVQIETFINREGTVTFNQLKQEFPDVSEMTLRNDLRALDDDRRIVRVYGGARSLGAVVGTDEAFDLRVNRNSTEKHLIVKKALRLLRPGMSVYLDSGSTAVLLAGQFPDDSYMVFTSGINCALELAKLKNVKAHLIGGAINPNSLSVNGIRSINEVERLNFNLAILGTVGFTPEVGFNCPVEAETELKRAVIRKSEKVAVLMDSHKVGRVNTFTFASPEEIDVVITDSDLPAVAKEVFDAAGTVVL